MTLSTGVIFLTLSNNVQPDKNMQDKRSNGPFFYCYSSSDSTDCHVILGSCLLKNMCKLLWAPV